MSSKRRVPEIDVRQMSGPIDEAHHWRQRAQQARKQLAIYTDPAAIAEMNGVIETYERLARWAEGDRARDP
jgi:hypothetical protein